MIKLRNITKTFGDFKALDDLSLTVPKGAVYGLVGPNGAGKSTAIRVMTGVYCPDSGDVTMEQIARWLDNIAPRINMTPISRPYVIFDRAVDPAFISGVLVVAQSHIAFHYSILERTANIDIFSCSFLDDGVVEDILEQSFGDDVQINLFARGSKHKHNIRYSEKYNSSLQNHKAWQNNI